MAYTPKKKSGLLIPKGKEGLTPSNYVAKTEAPSPGKTSFPLTDENTWSAGSAKYGKPAAEKVAREWAPGKTFARLNAYAQPLDSALQANFPRFSEAKRAIQVINPDDIEGRNRVVDSLKTAGHTYALTPEQERQSLSKFGPGAYEDFQTTRREALATRPSNVLGSNEAGVDISQSRWGIGNSSAVAPPVAKYTDSYDDQAGNVYPRAKYSTRIGYSPQQKSYSYETKADTIYPVPNTRVPRFGGVTATRKQGGLLNGKKL